LTGLRLQEHGFVAFFIYRFRQDRFRQNNAKRCAASGINTQEGAKMSKRLYVGNLSYKADEETLKEMFGEVGDVLSVKIITDAATGRSKGFGFVEMSSDEDAEKAIANLNGKTVMERALTVNEARPLTDRPKTGGGGRKTFDRGGRKSGNWR
jgi:cold-inducible RNA-binding protein